MTGGIGLLLAVGVLVAIFVIVDWRDRKRRHEDAALAHKRKWGRA